MKVSCQRVYALSLLGSLLDFLGVTAVTISRAVVEDNPRVDIFRKIRRDRFVFTMKSASHRNHALPRLHCIPL